MPPRHCTHRSLSIRISDDSCLPTFRPRRSTRAWGRNSESETIFSVRVTEKLEWSVSRMRSGSICRRCHQTRSTSTWSQRCSPLRPNATRSSGSVGRADRRTPLSCFPNIPSRETLDTKPSPSPATTYFDPARQVNGGSHGKPLTALYPAIENATTAGRDYYTGNGYFPPTCGTDKAGELR